MAPNMVTTFSMPDEFEESDAEAAFQEVRRRSTGVEQELLDEEGGSVSAVEFARRLGVDSIEDLEKAGAIVSVVHRGQTCYPSWQIHHGKLLSGLSEVLAELRSHNHHPWTIISYFITPSDDDLHDGSPLQELRRGRVEAVLAHAQRFGDLGT